ncbi:restriction endonuclease subunit S [Roseomonas mucosa]|uniref:restriction endonuclease subunit S n=1 Tax=Roseomonas mucosa TaxID=207340 RepID=UPI0030CEEFBC
MPIVRVSDVRNGRIDVRSPLRVAADIERTYGRTRLRGGELLITIVGTVGETAIVPPDMAGWNVARAIAVLPVKPEVGSYWVQLGLRSSAAASMIQSRLNTTVQATLNLGDLSRLPIVLPPPDERQAIASILGALDDKIELNRRMNKTLEGMARAIFQDWFVAFGPTRAKMEGRPPYHAPDLWALFPDRLDAEGKPEGWDTGPLSSLMEIISGGTPPTSDSSSWNGQIPWYSVVDAPSDTDLFVFDTQRKLTSHGLQRSPGSLIAANTVIVSARGTVGKLAIAGVEMTFNQSCYALRPLRGFGDRGLFFAMKNAVSRFHDLAHGAVFDTITKATFDAIQSILPPASVARAFEDIAEPLMLRIKANVEEGRSLAATRDLLLPRLMSGELRVKDAERAVEEAA